MTWSSARLNISWDENQELLFGFSTNPKNDPLYDFGHEGLQLKAKFHRVLVVTNPNNAYGSESTVFAV